MSAKQQAESKPLRVDYVFTTFPTLSETFYQREVNALRALGVELRVYSLWGGESSFEGLEVVQFPKWKLVTIPFWIGYWLVLKPRPMLGLLRRLLGGFPPALINLAENLLGVGFALIHARQLGERSGILHAAWATGPLALFPAAPAP